MGAVDWKWVTLMIFVLKREPVERQQAQILSNTFVYSVPIYYKKRNEPFLSHFKVTLETNRLLLMFKIPLIFIQIHEVIVFVIPEVIFKSKSCRYFGYLTPIYSVTSEEI